MIAYWGVPLLVITFSLIYWVLSILNYTNPDIEAMMKKENEEKDEDRSVWMMLGILGLGSCLLMVCGWFLYPRVTRKMQELKGKAIVPYTG